MPSFTLLLALVFIFSACSSSQKKQAHNLRQPASLSELIEDTPALLQKTKSDFNQDTCASFIQGYVSQVYDKPADYYYPKTDSEAQLLLQKGPEVINTLLNLRLAVQNKFKSFKNPNAECIDATRTAIRFTRFAEESVMDWLDNKQGRKEKYKGVFATAWPYMMKSSEDFQLETGDVVLMRGQRFVSAMIARIGDSDAQFSHLAIVGEDDKGEKYMVESLIETGAIKTKLSDFVKKEEIRAVVYRHADRELAKRAGRLAYQRISEAQKKGGNIPYDFAMNPHDHSQLFCAEVVQMAYEEASNKQLQLPLYKTSFRRMMKTQFLKDLSMSVEETFAPADIELEPNFQWIAEWRFVPILRKTKTQDAIFTSVFDWMENRGYELRAEPGLWAKAQVVFLLRQMGLLSSKMQKHMNPTILKTFLRIQKLSEPLEKHLFKINDDYYVRHGYSMSFKDLLHEMETYRYKDCKAYKASLGTYTTTSKNEFHWMFNGPGSCE